MASMTSWFVLRVQLRQERRVAAYLNELGVLAYCPIETRMVEVRTRFARRHVPRTGALMPGYVFAVLPDVISLDTARNVRLVRDIMCDALGKPRTVDLARLRGIFLAEMFRAFDASYKPPRKRHGFAHRFKAGDTVRAERGLAEGWIGEVIGLRGRQQIEVMFTMFGRAVPVLVNDGDLTQLASTPDVALVAA